MEEKRERDRRKTLTLLCDLQELEATRPTNGQWY